MNRREFVRKGFGVAGIAALVPTTGLSSSSPSRDERTIDGVGVFVFPSGMIEMEDGKLKSCQAIAQEICEVVGKGTIICLPSTRDECGNLLWDFRIEGGNPQHVEVRHNGPSHSSSESSSS